MRDTIAGIATAPGEGGVAIVRVSGGEAVALFTSVFRAHRRQPPYESHRLMYGHIVDENGHTVDEAMGVVMLAPNSYTREDVCELHTHGGHAAAQTTLRLLLTLGARPAEAGEFTRRAFMNGRLDLSQAEAVMGVIGARSRAALRAEQALLEGGASRFIRGAQDMLLRLIAGVEAHIDFPDEVEEGEATRELRAGLMSLAAGLETAADERGARILRQGLRVALYGRPNAGKSTLFNALLGEERAIVTAMPGTTRDVLEGAFSLNGLNVQLLDTAGLRESDNEAERIGVGRARGALATADAALLLVDASAPLTGEDTALLAQPTACHCAVLLSKGDLPAQVTLADVSARSVHAAAFAVSAETGQGMEQVRGFLLAQARLPGETLLTHERHIAAAQAAAAKLRQAEQALESGLPLDMAAVDLREALWLLGRVTGESVDEKLLDEIFSTFCVGK